MSGCARVIGRVLATLGAASAIAMAIAALMWWKLPAWAPTFVVRNSPWLDPLMRAESDGAVSEERDARLSEIGDDLARRLAPYLRSDDARVRQTAAYALGENHGRPEALRVLIRAAERGCTEARAVVDGIAKGEFGPTTGEGHDRATTALARYGDASDR